MTHSRLHRRAALCAALLALVTVLSAIPAGAAPAGDIVERYLADVATLAATRTEAKVTRVPIQRLLADLQTRTGVVLLLDPIVRRERTDAQLAVTLGISDASLKTILDAAAYQIELALAWQDGVWVITLPELAEERTPRAHAAIDVTTLVAERTRCKGGYAIEVVEGEFVEEEEEYDEPVTGDVIVTLIQETIAGDSWDEPNSIDFRTGVLYVTHRPEVVAAVRSLIADLKRFAARGIAYDVRFYGAAPGFGRTLAASPIVDAANRKALFDKLASSATLLHGFRNVMSSGEQVALVDWKKRPYVRDQDPEVAQGSAVQDPQQGWAREGVAGQLAATIDSVSGVCYVELRAGCARDLSFRTVTPGKLPGGDDMPVGPVMLPSMTIASSGIAGFLRDGATLVHWAGDSESGRETIVTVTVKLRGVTNLNPPPAVDPRDTALREKLAKPIDLDVNAVTATAFLEKLRDTAGVQMVIDPSIHDEDLDLISLTARGVAASTLLDVALGNWRYGGVTSRIADGVLWIGLTHALRAQLRVETRMHDIAGVTLRHRDLGIPSWGMGRNSYSDYDSADALYFADSDYDDGIAMYPDDLIEVLALSSDGNLDVSEPVLTRIGGALVVRNSTTAQQRYAEMIAHMARRRAHAVTVELELLELGRATFERLFPAGVLRDDSVLSADDLGLIRNAKGAAAPRVIGSASISALNLQSTYARSIRRVGLIDDLDTEVAQEARVMDPIIGTVRGGFHLRVRPVIGDDGAVQVAVDGTVASVPDPAPQGDDFGGIESIALHQIEIDARESVKSGETFAVVLGGPRPDESAPLVMLVTPRIVSAE